MELDTTTRRRRERTRRQSAAPAHDWAVAVESATMSTCIQTRRMVTLHEGVQPEMRSAASHNSDEGIRRRHCGRHVIDAGAITRRRAQQSGNVMKTFPDGSNAAVGAIEHTGSSVPPEPQAQLPGSDEARSAAIRCRF
jgi:hypothetical protein